MARLALYLEIEYTMKKRCTRALKEQFNMTLEEVTARLKEFETNPKMITESIYSPAATDYADSRMPFTEIHLGYLRKHKNVDPEHYLSNLEIMITRR